MLDTINYTEKKKQNKSELLHEGLDWLFYKERVPDKGSWSDTNLDTFCQFVSFIVGQT